MSDAVLAVVPAHHVGPAGGERAGGDHPGAAEAEHGDFFAGEGGDGDHSFRSHLWERGVAYETTVAIPSPNRSRLLPTSVTFWSGRTLAIARFGWGEVGPRKRAGRG